MEITFQGCSILLEPDLYASSAVTVDPYPYHLLFSEVMTRQPPTKRLLTHAWLRRQVEVNYAFIKEENGMLLPGKYQDPLIYRVRPYREYHKVANQVVNELINEENDFRAGLTCGFIVGKYSQWGIRNTSIAIEMAKEYIIGSL